MNSFLLQIAVALRRQPVASPSVRTPQQVIQQQQQPQQQQQQVQPAVVNSVFRSADEINIPLQQRRPNFYQPTTVRYESDEEEQEVEGY